MNKAEPPLFGQPIGLAAGRVVVVAVQHHLGAAGCHGPHLHLRRGHRHHDHGAATQLLGTQRHTLSVVPGTGGDHAPFQFSRTEARHLVVSAPQLEAEHGLQVFPLQQHGVGEPAREVGGGIEGGFDRHVVDPRPQDALQHPGAVVDACLTGVTHRPSLTDPV